MNSTSITEFVQGDFESLSDQQNLLISAYDPSDRASLLLNSIKKEKFDEIIFIDESLIKSRPSEHSIDIRSALKKFQDLSTNFDGEEFRVTVDISCLSRSAISEIFSAVKILLSSKRVRLTIGYSLARFEKPSERQYPINQKIAPIHPSFSGWSLDPSAPVDMIVGLGYENGKAIGAVEYLEPRKKWVFMPTSPELKFSKAVRMHNKNLLDSCPLDSVVSYEVLNPIDNYFKLMSLLNRLTLDSKPILLPFGPKIFFAVCLLIGIVFEDVAIWDVHDNSDVTTNLKRPSDHHILLSCLIKTGSESET